MGVDLTTATIHPQPIPDFGTLHKAWESSMESKKADAKERCARSHHFRLVNSSNPCRHASPDFPTLQRKWDRTLARAKSAADARCRKKHAAWSFGNDQLYAAPHQAGAMRYRANKNLKRSYGALRSMGYQRGDVLVD